MENGEREKYLIGRIQALQEEYRKAIQPYVEKLAEIRFMSSPSIFVSKEQAGQVLKELSHK